MGMPSALTSALRATTQPSLLERTTTGRSFRRGLNSFSQRRVEVVAIDQGEDRHRDQAAKRLNLPTTTPQTSSSMPSWISSAG